MNRIYREKQMYRSNKSFRQELVERLYMWGGGGWRKFESCSGSRDFSIRPLLWLIARYFLSQIAIPSVRVFFQTEILSFGSGGTSAEIQNGANFFTSYTRYYLCPNATTNGKALKCYTHPCTYMYITRR